MNEVHAKNNLFRSGAYSPSYSRELAKEKAKDIVPSVAQTEFRDNLYKFCNEKGLIRNGFKMRRTKQGIASNIHALITIIKKNGLYDEFFKNQPAE